MRQNLDEKNTVQYIYINIFPSCRHNYSFFNTSTNISLNFCIPMLYINFFNVIECNTFVNRSVKLSHEWIYRTSISHFSWSSLVYKNLGEILLVLSSFIYFPLIYEIQATLFSYNLVALTWCKVVHMIDSRIYWIINLNCRHS